MVDQTAAGKRFMNQRSSVWQRTVFGLALIAVSLLGNLLLIATASAAPGRPEVYTKISEDVIAVTGGYFVDKTYNLTKIPGTNNYRGGVHAPEFDYPFAKCLFRHTINVDDANPHKGVVEIETGFGNGSNCTTQPENFEWGPVIIAQPGQTQEQAAAAAGGGGAAGANEIVATCDAGAFTWLLCPFIVIAQDGVRILQGWVENVLVVTPFNTSSPLYSAWSAFRNLADVFFVLIFFVIIFGTGLGLDNYTVKKILPRLIAAAILVQFSYILSSIAVDFSNILGLGLSQLVASAVPAQFNAEKSTYLQVAAPIAGLLTLGVAGGTIIAIGALVPVMLALASAFLSMLAVFVTLEIRLILINFLVVISPFAFVFWVLPNTQQYFKMWWEYFSKLLLMFPIIMLMFTAANLFNQVTITTNTGDFNGDIAKNIIASLLPIFVFFLVPATFKLAGSALAFGHGLVTRAGGGTNKGLQSAFWGKDQQERSKLKGQQKLMNLRDQGPASTRLGRFAQNAQKQAAQKRSGFGFGADKGLKGLQMNRALDKTASELAQSAATKDFHAQYGKQTYANTMANRKAAEMDKMLTQSANEAFLNQEVDVGGVNLKIKDVNLNESGIKSLKDKVKSALSDGDHATAIAAMTKLSQSQSGEDALQQLRADPNVFGGTDTEPVINKLKDVWSKGTANAKSPDFKKPPQNAWSDLSQEEITSMSNKQVNRALEYYNRNASDPKAQKAAKQFSDNFQKILANPNTASKINPDSVDAVQNYQWAKDTTTGKVLTGTPHQDRTVFSSTSDYQAAAHAASLYTKPGSATPPPAQPAPQPAAPPPQPTPTPLTQPTVNVNVQPTKPTIITAPRAGTQFQQPTPGSLYVPSSYQPPTTNPRPPKVDVAVEEHRDDQIGDDRSIS